jgi:hypothetical protein
VTLQEFKEQYLITDADLLSLKVSYSTDNSAETDDVTIRLNGRKMLPKNKQENVLFSLRFQGMRELYYHDTFDSKAISHSTLTKNSTGEFYLSLDPFDEGEPSEEDNMIVKSKQLFFMDENDKEHEIN